jgi:cytochrome c553
MSKRLLFALAGMAVFATHGVLAAPPGGDAQAGASKASTCAACHGMDGNSPAPEWPKLAGQHPEYTWRHTVLIRDGGRENLTMLPFVQGLSDQDIADIAAYYANKTVSPGVADDSVIVGRDDELTYAALGQQIYRAGKPSAGVPACMACHGPTGRGVPGAGFPAVAGQFAQYTAARLRYFHEGKQYGTDETDPSTIMVTIAQRLDETEIDALATYMEGLHRADAAAGTAQGAAGSTAAPAAPSPSEGEAPVGAEPDATTDGEPVPAIEPPAGDGPGATGGEGMTSGMQAQGGTPTTAAPPTPAAAGTPDVPSAPAAEAEAEATQDDGNSTDEQGT